MAEEAHRPREHGWLGTRVQNIRRVKDSGMMDYPTISLLFGKNSSGKTSLLRAPLLLKQAFDNTYGNEAILAGRYLDLGSYKEAVSDGLVSRDIKLTAVLGPLRGVSRSSIKRVNPVLQPLLDGMQVDVTIHWNQRAGQPQYAKISFSKISAEGEPIVNLVRTGPESFRVEISDFPHYTVDLPLSPTATRFMDLPPQTGEEAAQGISFGLFYISTALQQGVSELIHIGPLREEPQRSYRTETTAISASAESAVAVLRSGEGIDAIQRSLKQLKMAEEVRLQKLAPGFVAVSLHDPESGRIDNLADVGFGVSQVLPILATLATAMPSSTILIEQPELHLHPEAQGALADVLIELALERRLRLVIETHSEHLLLRIQRRIAEAETLHPSDVAVYFVDGGSVSRAQISPLGQIDPSAMPSGFFDEDWEDLMKLTEAAAKRAS